MINSQIILEWTKALKEKVERSPFDKDDIRTEFAGMQWDIVYNFYKGNLVFELSDLANHKLIGFSGELKDFQDHIYNFFQITSHDGVYASYRNWLVRALMISTWSNFELCASTFCDAIIDGDERTKLFQHQLADINKCLKKSTIASDDKESLSNTFSKGHLTHVPIIRKTDVLFKKTKDYTRDKKEDKAFLSMFGRLRNTMHTNFIYFGKTQPDYRFRDAIFRFVNGEIVTWNDPYKNMPELYLALIDELILIWTEICRAIEHDELIPYPAEGQE